MHWLTSVTAAFDASRHVTERVREPVLQGCEQLLQVAAFHVQAAALQLCVVMGLAPLPLHCASTAATLVLDMQGTARVCAPPPQRAEHEPQAAGAHW